MGIILAIRKRRSRLNSFGRLRFAVEVPSTWNSLPDSLRDSELSLDTFKRQLKTDFLRNIDEYAL